MYSIQVSLTFDLLLAMSTGLMESDFLSGNCGKAYNKKQGYKLDTESELLMEIGRNKVWQSLSKFKLKAGWKFGIALKLKIVCMETY